MTGLDAHKSLSNYSLKELESVMVAFGEPTYRARQIYHDLYRKRVTSYDAMMNLPRHIRKRLLEEMPLFSLKHVNTRIGDQGLTRKALFETPQRAPVEAVLMIYSDRATVCVSTQSGCALGCSFCATGRMGFRANLMAGQIVEQVLWAARELDSAHAGRKLTNIVYMGMGEPFLNYEAWWQSVQRLHDPAGLGLGARSFTVSTAGVVPGILRLANEPLPVNLAVSLHAATDSVRSQIVPLNRKYPLREMLTAVRVYADKSHRRVTFEYVLLEDINDRAADAHALADFCWGKMDGGKRLLCHVNLIPWNPILGASLQPAKKRRIAEFQRILEKARIPCTLRTQRGTDIAAACGQLAGTVHCVSS